MLRPFPVALAALLLTTAACASSKPPPPIASTQAIASDASAKVLPRGDTSTPTSSSVHIEDRILRACGDIPAAHFAFDSARIQPDAGAALGALARCFSTGPLAGKGMSLVGHADPRGETEYNLALGQRRAGSVATFEEGHGVRASNVTTTSRGAFDATGTDEQGWARDRRVDVLLAE
jgi:peptidoglycan-associated lipoprotein